MNSTRISKEVLLIASEEDLEVGDTLAGLVCPICKGGHSGERSFNITREGHGVLFNCYRNSCSCRGFAATAGWSVTNKGKQSSKHRSYTRRTEGLGEEHYQFFREKFELKREVVDFAGWRLGIEDGRVIMPVRNSNGYDIGVMARSYDPKADKKAIAYPDNTKSPWLAYYRQATDSAVVLVEDQVSALKLSQFLPSVALLGTDLNDEKAVDIASSFSNVLLWLDADARAKAYELREIYRLMFRNFIVHSGSNLDPKDSKLEDIHKILVNYKLV